MIYKDIMQNPEIVSAITNHDESNGVVADPIAAALIIADKTDVRRSRVRAKDPILFDIHDRANYAGTKTKLSCDSDQKVITLHLTIDENICTMYEYFDIFLGHMTMCSHAARIGAVVVLRRGGTLPCE